MKHARTRAGAFTPRHFPTPHIAAATFGGRGAGQGQGKELIMNVHTSHLRPDGTTWPPVTPDPPPPPGYVDPIPALDDALRRERETEPDPQEPADAE
jgi:hypothetical protein